jgi:trans-aconitate methyltransferase
LKTAFVYRNARTYEMVMFLLYGKHYFTRYHVLANLIESDASVLDLCCGPGILYERYLRTRNVSYTGLDINENFIRRVNRLGDRSRGMVWDLHENKPLPPADVVVMQASLYHFLPSPEDVVNRMLQAAKRKVIVAEPIRNWSTGNASLLKSLGKRLTNPGTGRHEMRFNEQTLDQFFARYSSSLLSSFVMPGGREKIYVIAAAT